MEGKMAKVLSWYDILRTRNDDPLNPAMLRGNFAGAFSSALA
jgi:hypothetical protein